MPDTPLSVPLTVEEYRARILRDLAPLSAYPMPLMDTLGLAAVGDVSARVALPSFDNAALDGYAVAYADVASATPAAPVTLPVVGENAAGASTLLALPPGAALRISTGAPLPAGADTVVPRAATDGAIASVQVHLAPRAVGQHVRHAGEDVAAGDVVVSAGSVVGPRQLGLLAATGHGAVPARPRPRVVVLSTGTELREPGQPLGRDSIHDANSFLLAAAVTAAGGLAYRVGIAPDEPDAFLEALDDQLVRADLVLISGGVSDGEGDVVRAALAPRGVWFGEVAMEPGRQHGFGYVGPDVTPLIALPGDPVAAWVGFMLVVRPALRRLQGLFPTEPVWTRARLLGPIGSAAPAQEFLRGMLSRDAGGAPTVSVVGGSGSHLLGDVAVATCLISVPAGVRDLPEGAEVEVLAFDA